MPVVTLDQVPAFFSNLLTALRLKEHDHGFSPQNIPNYMIDQTFYVEIGQITAGAASQLVHAFSVPVTLNVYFKDYRTPNRLRAAAFAKAHEILQLVLQVKVRTMSGIKDIRPQSISLVPLSPTNEKTAILSMGFEVILNYVFQGEI